MPRHLLLLSLAIIVFLVAGSLTYLIISPNPQSQLAQVSLQHCSSIFQYGITWTFDKPPECGQFVNGDWWVVGPVTIQSMLPEATIWAVPFNEIHCPYANGCVPEKTSCSIDADCDQICDTSNPSTCTGITYEAHCVDNACEYTGFMNGWAANITQKETQPWDFRYYYDDYASIPSLPFTA